MKIDARYKVREMAGEHVVIMQGRYGADMTRVVALNETSLFLWNALEDRDFDIAEAARLLTERYGVEEVHRQQAKGEQASQFHSFVSKSHSRSFSVQAAASRRAVASSTP